MGKCNDLLAAVATATRLMVLYKKVAF